MLGQTILSSVDLERLSSIGGLNCTGTVGRSILNLVHENVSIN